MCRCTTFTLAMTSQCFDFQHSPFHCLLHVHATCMNIMCCCCCLLLCVVCCCCFLLMLCCVVLCCNWCDVFTTNHWVGLCSWRSRAGPGATEPPTAGPGAAEPTTAGPGAAEPRQLQVYFVYDMISIVCTLLYVLCVSVVDVVVRVLPVGLTTRCLRHGST